MAEMKYFIRVADTDLDGKKQIEYALTKIKGVKYSYANAVCNLLNLDKKRKAGSLTEEEIKKLNQIIKNPQEFLPKWLFNRRKDIKTGEDKHLLVSNLKLTREQDIKREKKIKSYRGMRHAWGLPVRGQRTRSNFRTGSAVGVVKKKIKQTKK